MFIPFFSKVVAPQESPQQWMVVLHGIYGSGRNWRSFARKFCAAKPDWGVLLVDLRMHGKSLNAPEPHSLRACADDIIALLHHADQEGMKVHTILGHSFGGKVALEVKRVLAEQGRVGTHSTWLVDSSPAPRSVSLQDDQNTVVRVLRILREIPKTFASRDDFVAEFVNRGLSRALALWLAMNVVKNGEAYACALDPDAMESLLSDYYRNDLWSELETSASPIHVAIASTQSAISSEDRDRLESLELAGAVTTHALQGGHWLHVDALEALVALVADAS